MRLDDRSTWSDYGLNGASPFMPRNLSRAETVVHQAADDHVAKIEAAIRYAFAQGRDVVSATHPNPIRVSHVIRMALLDVLPPVLLETLVAGGNAGFVLLDEQLRVAGAYLHTLAEPPLKMRFDAKNANAIKWAKEHAAELAQNLSDTSEQAIRDALAASLAGELSSREAYKAIVAAVGDKKRAEVIARNETMVAASEGQRQAWDQAVEAGRLNGDERRVWIVTHDDRLCPFCAALDGAEATLDGQYPGDGGDGPPLHVQCRCSEGIIG